MDRWKSRGGKSQKREEKRREEKKEDQRRENVRRKNMQARERVEQSRFTVFFQSFVAPEGRKVGSPKRRVRSHLARWEMKSCTPLWHEAHLQVKKLKAPHVRSTFGSWEVEMWKKCAPLWRQAHFEVKMYKAHRGQNTFRSWDVEKVYAVVARSTFRSQKCKELTGSEYFWKLTCRKYACHCGAKHISKSECTKHFSLGTLLEAQMSTKCTPLWREARFEVKRVKVKNWRSRSTFGSWDVEKVHAVVARSTFPGQTVKSTTCSDHFWRFRCGFVWQAQGIPHLSHNTL